jgi:hypothetical protein
MGRKPRPARERFFRQTRITDSGCVEWTGFLDRDGYGQFRPGGRDSSKVRAHRWAYEHFIGAIPGGMVLDHLCRNRCCVNVDHLEVVTPRENWLRGNGPARINADKTHCLNDHPLSGDNLILNGGKRACRTCRRAYGLAGYHRRKKAS